MSGWEGHEVESCAGYLGSLGHTCEYVNMTISWEWGEGGTEWSRGRAPVMSILHLYSTRMPCRFVS